MLEVSEHLTQSLHNETFSADFNQTQYADWAVTVRFYTAAHLVRAWLIGRRAPKSKLKTHVDIAEQLKNFRLDPNLDKAYRKLSDLSREARYDCLPVAELEECVGEAQVLLEQIRNGLMPEIRRNLPPEDPR